MDTTLALKILKEEGIFWSRLGFGIDPPCFDGEGRNILHEPPEEYFRYHRDMAAAGVKVHTCIVPSGWVDSGTYDFTTAEEIVGRLMAENPEIWFLPRIKVNPPAAWMKRHPSEVCVLADGLSDEAEIAGLVGTEKQDLIGKPEAGHLISNQSLSSEAWRSEAKEYLRRLIGLLERKSYSGRIIGYHIGYGRCGETHIWDTDFGISEKRHFYEFGLRKYGSAEVLREKWKMASDDPDCVPIPGKDARRARTGGLEEFFHAGDRYVPYVDYNLYKKENSAAVLEDFAKLVKEMTGKAVGFFHGYVMTDLASAHGHTDLEPVLGSPYVDFLCAPKSYYRNSLGEPGGSYAPPLSVNLKKLWIDENDCRNEGDADAFIRVLWREFAKDLSADTPFWWMDLLGGWYDDERVRSAVSEMLAVKRRLPARRDSIAEILLVTDEDTALYTMQDHRFYTRIIQETQAQTALSGMPYDVYRLRDLGSIRLDRYRVIVFLNCFEIPEETGDLFWKGIRKGAAVIFQYACGIQSGGFSLENVEKTTGFRLKERPERRSMPYLEVVKTGNVRPVCSFREAAASERENPFFALDDIPETDAAAVAELTREDGGTSVMAAVPVLTAGYIRNIALAAGCRDWAPYDTVVYGDSRFLGIFAHGDVRGTAAPGGGCFDARTNEAVPDTIGLDLRKGEFLFLVRED